MVTKKELLKVVESSIDMDRLVTIPTKDNTANYSNNNNKHVYAYEKTLEERIKRVTRYDIDLEVKTLMKLRKLKDTEGYHEFS